MPRPFSVLLLALLLLLSREGQSSPSPADAKASTAPSARGVSELLDRGRDIRFELNTSNLAGTSHAFLDLLADRMKAEPTFHLEVGVHVGRSGNPKRDLELSQERTDVIKNALVSRGVPMQRLLLKAFGSDEPLAPNLTRTGRRKNERIELHRLSHH